jgi:hypothetical protein
MEPADVGSRNRTVAGVLQNDRVLVEIRRLEPLRMPAGVAWVVRVACIRISSAGEWAR